jgi:hypothetical protein
MTETVLFVGGPHDGRIMEINGGEQARIICFPASPAGTDAYHRYLLCCGRGFKAFYLISTESPDNLIPLLIEGYRQQKAGV